MRLWQQVNCSRSLDPAPWRGGAIQRFGGGRATRLGHFSSISSETVGEVELGKDVDDSALVGSYDFPPTIAARRTQVARWAPNSAGR